MRKDLPRTRSFQRHQTTPACSSPLRNTVLQSSSPSPADAAAAAASPVPASTASTYSPTQELALSRHRKSTAASPSAQIGNPGPTYNVRTRSSILRRASPAPPVFVPTTAGSALRRRSLAGPSAQEDDRRRSLGGRRVSFAPNARVRYVPLHKYKEEAAFTQDHEQNHSHSSARSQPPGSNIGLPSTPPPSPQSGSASELSSPDSRFQRNSLNSPTAQQIRSPLLRSESNRYAAQSHEPTKLRASPSHHNIDHFSSPSKRALTQTPPSAIKSYNAAISEEDNGENSSAVPEELFERDDSPLHLSHAPSTLRSEYTRSPRSTRSTSVRTPAVETLSSFEVPIPYTSAASLPRSTATLSPSSMRSPILPLTASNRPTVTTTASPRPAVSTALLRSRLQAFSSPHLFDSLARHAPIISSLSAAALPSLSPASSPLIASTRRFSFAHTTPSRATQLKFIPRAPPPPPPPLTAINTKSFANPSSSDLTDTKLSSANLFPASPIPLLLRSSSSKVGLSPFTHTVQSNESPSTFVNRTVSSTTANMLGHTPQRSSATSAAASTPAILAAESQTPSAFNSPLIKRASYYKDSRAVFDAENTNLNAGVPSRPTLDANLTPRFSFGAAFAGSKLSPLDLSSLPSNRVPMRTPQRLGRQTLKSPAFNLLVPATGPRAVASPNINRLLFSQPKAPGSPLLRAGSPKIQTLLNSSPNQNSSSSPSAAAVGSPDSDDLQNISEVEDLAGIQMPDFMMDLDSTLLSAISDTETRDSFARANQGVPVTFDNMARLFKLCGAADISTKNEHLVDFNNDDEVFLKPAVTPSLSRLLFCAYQYRLLEHYITIGKEAVAQVTETEAEMERMFGSPTAISVNPSSTVSVATSAPATLAWLLELADPASCVVDETTRSQSVAGLRRTLSFILYHHMQVQYEYLEAQENQLIEQLVEDLELLKQDDELLKQQLFQMETADAELTEEAKLVQQEYASTSNVYNNELSQINESLQKTQQEVDSISNELTTLRQERDRAESAARNNLLVTAQTASRTQELKKNCENAINETKKLQHYSTEGCLRLVAKWNQFSAFIGWQVARSLAAEYDKNSQESLLKYARFVPLIYRNQIRVYLSAVGSNAASARTGIRKLAKTPVDRWRVEGILPLNSSKEEKIGGALITELGRKAISMCTQGQSVPDALKWLTARWEDIAPLCEQMKKVAKHFYVSVSVTEAPDSPHPVAQFVVDIADPAKFRVEVEFSVGIAANSLVRYEARVKRGKIGLDLIDQIVSKHRADEGLEIVCQRIFEACRRCLPR